MTQDAVQFSGAVIVVYGRDSPACFSGRQVTPLYGALSPNPSKRDGKKVSCSAFSTGLKVSSMTGVTRCMNSHSCWSDFCSPEKVDCRCLRDTPTRVPTEFAHPSTFPARQLFSAAPFSMNPPRYQLPVTIFSLIPRKNSTALATFLGATTKILLVGSRR